MSYATFQNKSTLNNLPSNWAVRKFTDIVLDVSAGNDKVKKRDYRTKGKYPVIDQSQSLVAGYTSDHRPVKAKGPCIAFGDHTRAVKYVEFPFVMGADGVKVLICDENVLTKYIYYFLNSIEIPDTGYNRHFKFLKDLSIPLPPLEEQKRIADILDKAQALTTKAKTQIENLRLLKIAYYYAYCGNPYRASEERGKLSSVVEINPSKKEIDGQMKSTSVSFVRMEDISEFGELLNLREGTISDFDKGYTYFRDDDVLFAKITPCMENGKGALVRGLKNGIGFGSTEFHVVRAINKKSHPVWIKELLQLSATRQIAELFMTGSAGQKRVPTNFFERLKLVIPDYSTQVAFAEVIEKVDRMIDNKLHALRRLAELNNSLLQRAFKGELTKQRVG